MRNCFKQAVTLTENRADFRSRVKTRYRDLSTTIRGSCVSPLPQGSILVQFYCCFPIKRIWNEFGIIGGRGPRIQAGAPEGGPAAGGVPGV
jgi:hypothetical protein